MNHTIKSKYFQRLNTFQQEIIPVLQQEVGNFSPKLERLIHTLEWARIEEFVDDKPLGFGRPGNDRGVLAHAFLAKAILGIPTTVGLVERLSVDKTLRRICGFPLWRKIPTESTFSRAFAEFARTRLGERVHEALVKEALGGHIVGHISRDATAIEAREKPAPRGKVKKIKHRRGRPLKGDVREVKVSKLEKQLGQTLEEMLAEISTECDHGTKSNAQGYKNSWNGYKLHLDTADCGIPVSVVITSASVHDSQVAIPLALITEQRVTHCYDLMDAAYCSNIIREHSKSMGHVAIIDHNPRGGEKIDFCPAQKQRYKERTQAKRSNGRLKDEFGARHLRVKGPVKAMSHLMFGVVALTADQIFRLVT